MSITTLEIRKGDILNVEGMLVRAASIREICGLYRLTIFNIQCDVIDELGTEHESHMFDDSERSTLTIQGNKHTLWELVSRMGE
ncbi:MAG: hypothetical protein Unbinned6354contig1000_30 [Prokaryotic dsDNA virus sp.]|nr:hypothetical protein [Cytophagaceae bacterium]QDP54327.1 MAG: hypothetical protein Unbinned6354contig1000_30 [Prokaryotic dsDNA virus sp.]|tara:strand:+ start:1630 stop:1881 length:252 start_codon:yes stop_codon:yes gene_type:complete